MKSDKIYTYDKMIQKCLEMEKDEKPYLLTNGCFDILHVSHVNNLKQCKLYNVPVVVFLNDDESIKKLKGANRPYYSLEERLFIISSIMYVDYVAPLHSTELCEIFKKIKPTYWAKGSDRNLETLNQKERYLAEKNNTKIVFIKNLSDISTSEILHKIHKENI